MLQNATYHIRFFAALILGIALAALLNLSAKKLLAKTRPIRSMTAVSLLLAGALVFTWGVSMYVLTMVTAQLLYGELQKAGLEFAGSAAACGGFQFYYEAGYPFYGQQEEYQEQLDYGMLRAVDLTRSYSWNNSLGEETRLMRDISIPIDSAVLFYDREGNLLFENGDYIYFRYVTQEDWDAGVEDDPTRTNFGWLDLGKEGEDDPYARFRASYAGVHSLWDYRALRITGTVDGTQIKPVALDYLTQGQVWNAEERLGPTEEGTDESGNPYQSYEYQLSSLDQAGLLEWQPQFDHTADVENQEELVTIYATHPEMCVYEGSPLTYRGEWYDSLLALTEEQKFQSGSGALWNCGDYGLDRILHFERSNYWDPNAPEEAPELDFVMVTATLSRPLWAAVCMLRNIYIGTGLLALAAFLLLRRMVKTRLMTPLCDINGGMAKEWSYVYSVDNRPKMWREADELYEHYQAELDQRRYSKNEITRLNKALNYAKKAEQNRRQMTSHIAHELKTPLAIIHSYSEGLKEHIAEEKREQYLDVILSEAERMDGMVLEMLDLSRLEAGKVKLTQDEFSLSALVRSVLDKFAALAEEKKLTITLMLDGDCPVIADEARIEQVLTNFVSNAVRYTPLGGTVLVKTSAGRDKTGFSVENTIEKPLTAEECSKVWETFYRTDKSRSSKGTGLGLAIAKNIVELHGGTCFVQNTDTGVEFGFTL